MNYPCQALILASTISTLWKNFYFPTSSRLNQLRSLCKQTAIMRLKTDFLKLLGISNYVAPGFSYDQFVRAYECEQTKGFFPHEWVNGLDKLNETSLPLHAAFYSSLKNANITEQEYEYCQQVWEENNMQTFEDFLVWYNNLEVVPFIEAVEKWINSGEKGRLICLKMGSRSLVWSYPICDALFSLLNQVLEPWLCMSLPSTKPPLLCHWDSFLTLVTGHLSTNFLLVIYELVTNNEEDFACYLYQQHCSCVPKIITAAHNLYSTLFYGTGFFWEELWHNLLRVFPIRPFFICDGKKPFFTKLNDWIWIWSK